MLYNGPCSHLQNEGLCENQEEDGGGAIDPPGRKGRDYEFQIFRFP